MWEEREVGERREKERVNLEGRMGGGDGWEEREAGSRRR